MHVLKMLGDSGVGDGFHLVLSYRRASGVSGQVGVAEGWGRPTAGFDGFCLRGYNILE